MPHIAEMETHEATPYHLANETESEDEETEEENNVVQDVRESFDPIVAKYKTSVVSLLMTLLNIKYDAVIPIHWFTNEVTLKNIEKLKEPIFTQGASFLVTLMYFVKFWDDVRFHDLIMTVKPKMKLGRLHSFMMASPLFLSIPWMNKLIISLSPKAIEYKQNINMSLVIACFMSAVCLHFRYKRWLLIM